MNKNEIVRFLLKTMPMPCGYKLYGEASIPVEFDGGLVVRRSMALDVTPGAVGKDWGQYTDLDGLPAKRMSQPLVNDCISIVSRVFKDGFGPSTQIGLDNTGSDDVYVNYTKGGCLMVRAKYGFVIKNKLYWNLGFIAVLYNVTGELGNDSEGARL